MQPRRYEGTREHEDGHSWLYKSDYREMPHEGTTEWRLMKRIGLLRIVLRELRAFVVAFEPVWTALATAK
jgi:hypothetical protein